jgi:hypothetical protein
VGQGLLAAFGHGFVSGLQVREINNLWTASLWFVEGKGRTNAKVVSTNYPQPAEQQQQKPDGKDLGLESPRAAASRAAAAAAAN